MEVVLGLQQDGTLHLGADQSRNKLYSCNHPIPIRVRT